MAQEGVYVFPEQGTRSNTFGDAATIAALSGNGGFGGMNNPFWMMFMWPLMYPFINMFGGNGWGGNSLNGAGYISTQLNNDVGRDLIVQAINGRADALGQLAQLTNTSISSVQDALTTVVSKLGEVGSQVGMSALQVLNGVQAGDATLGRQLCECCCENRLATCQQTNALQGQAAANASAAQLQLANHDADVRLQLAKAEAAETLGMCQQTNQLGSQADRNTNSILGAIANQNTLITKEFCDLKERELQNKIDTQGDIITQLRGQISNDKQTEAFNAAINALNEKVNQLVAKQPNTVPVQWPNIIAANATPYVGYGYGQTNFWN